MAKLYEIPLPESTQEELVNESRTAKPVWEKYQPWLAGVCRLQSPRIFDALRQWLFWHQGLPSIAKAMIYDSEATADEDYHRLCALARSLETAFDELGDLLEWAEEAWRHDPTLKKWALGEFRSEFSEMVSKLLSPPQPELDPEITTA